MLKYYMYDPLQFSALLASATKLFFLLKDFVFLKVSFIGHLGLDPGSAGPGSSAGTTKKGGGVTSKTVANAPPFPVDESAPGV